MFPVLGHNVRLLNMFIVNNMHIMQINVFPKLHKQMPNMFITINRMYILYKWYYMPIMWFWIFY